MHDARVTKATIMEARGITGAMEGGNILLTGTSRAR